MYYYILDQNGLPLEKYEKLQTELSGWLTEFKIGGEMARVTPLRAVADLVDAASQRGIKTLVACGNDDTFNQMLAALKGQDFTLGFIPLTDNSYLATILGIENPFDGVKTIAGRRIERMDLAKIFDNHFISYLEFGSLSQNLKTAGWLKALKLLSVEAKNYVIRIDDSYNVETAASGGLLVNSRLTSSKTASVANPTDSHLDLLLMEQLNKMQILMYRKSISDGLIEQVPKTTIIKCKKVQFLEPRGTPLTMLGRVVAKFPATVELIPQRLRMIVGRNRTF
jgi:diacylglycerol kinase family enzyme